MPLTKTASFVALLTIANVVSAAEPSHVAIDPSDGYATTFVGIPKTLPEVDFEKLKQSMVQRKGSYLVTWADFKGAPEKHIKSNIRRNDYPDIDLVAGMTKLLERYDGTPFGVTWNGGIAVTNKDYQLASRAFAVYSDRGLDPIHPLNHLEPLLRK
jgi:hypothetical protein